LGKEASGPLIKRSVEATCGDGTRAAYRQELEKNSLINRLISRGSIIYNLSAYL
jgi:hypothetical protein